MPGKYKYFQNEKLSRLIQIIKNYFLSHMVQKTHALQFLNENCKENNETFIEI